MASCFLPQPMISIHALRKECDALHFRLFFYLCEFQSTHSARSATAKLHKIQLAITQYIVHIAQLQGSLLHLCQIFSQLTILFFNKSGANFPGFYVRLRFAPGSIFLILTTFGLNKHQYRIYNCGVPLQKIISCGIMWPIRRLAIAVAVVPESSKSLRKRRTAQVRLFLFRDQKDNVK